MSNQVNISQPYVQQAATTTHYNRVVADSGTVDRLRDIDNKIQVQNVELGLSGNLLFASGASSGYKKSGALVDKSYDWSVNNKDLSGSGANRPSYNSTGRMNKGCYDFTGTLSTNQSKLQTAAYSFPNNNNQLTIMGWFYTSSAVGVGSVHTIFRTGTTSGTTGLWIYRSPASNTFTLRYLDNAFVDRLATIALSGGTTDFFNVWHHLAFTFDYTTKVVNIYRNGVLAGTLTITGVNPIYPSINDVKEFGYHTTLNSHGYIGSMDDLRVYDKVVTASQVGRITNEI